MGICNSTAQTRDDLLENWLNLTPEKPIEADMEIIDPHHHLWDPWTQPKGPISAVKKFAMFHPDTRRWIISKIFPTSTLTTFGYKTPCINKYMHEELLADMAGNNIQKTVYIECGWFEPGLTGVAGETAAYQPDPSDKTGICSGIVGHVDLTLGRDDVSKVLDAHEKAGKNFRGIRDALVYHDDASVRAVDGIKDKYKNPKFIEGLKVLEERGVTYDTWQYHSQLPELVHIAKECPKLTIVCDHISTPTLIGVYEGKRDEVMADWKKGMKELSKCPNVYVKLSGLTMGCCGLGFENRDAPPTSQELADAMSPYYMYVVETFGSDRCMFASNFPVDKIGCSYTNLWNSFKLMTQKLSKEDRRNLFWNTAAKVYKLESHHIQ